jgi:hypothetical protein
MLGDVLSPFVETVPKGETMDKVTVIRVVSGILAGVVLVILFFRTKKKAPR